MCEDISIADDFDAWLGVVSGGVSLLIRPAEANPTLPDIFQMSHSILQSKVTCGITVRIAFFHLKSEYTCEKIFIWRVTILMKKVDLNRCFSFIWILPFSLFILLKSELIFLLEKYLLYLKSECIWVYNFHLKNEYIYKILFLFEWIYKILFLFEWIYIFLILFIF